MSAEGEIRPIRPDDAEAVYVLRQLPSVIDGTLSMPSLRIGDVRRWIENLGADDHTFVTTVGGELVGMAGLHVNGRKARHSGGLGIMVHDRFQGRGIGRKLMEALLDMADNYLGLVRVELEVFPDNARAIRLYEDLGFAREGRKRKAVWRHGEHQDLLMMARVR